MAINPLQPPINFAGMVPQIDIGKQFAELGQVLAERQKRTQAEEVKAAYATDLQAVLDNPSMKAFNDFSLKYPQQREAVKDVASRFTQEQQDAEFNIGRDIAVSLENKNPDAALNILNKTIAARKNSNLPTTVYDQIQQILSNTDDPDRIKKAQAQTNFSLTLLNPEKFGKVVESLEKQRLESSVLKEAVAKAKKAEADAEEALAKAKDTPSRLMAEAALREAQTALQEALTAASVGGERRAAAEAPEKLRKAVADADAAMSAAITAQATATNAEEKAKADADRAKAEADKAKIEAQYAEGVSIDAIKKRAADLGLTTAQTNQALATTRKLGVETSKAALELQAIKDGVGDPKEKFAQEEKIRKEWQGRSKMYGELQGTFSTLKASADSANGPGDIALITGFMKMLDPGSVVRETEFATARDTAGLFMQLQNRLQKAQNGQLLSPEQRKEYVALSQKYLDAAQTRAAQERKDLGIVVKNYKLNPQNVFGAETAPTQPAALPASATVGGKTYSRPASFTDAQWRDYLKANGVIQ